MVRTAKARSRDDLRRGLFVSGAMHLALLYVILHLPHGSEEVLIRSYANPVDIIHEGVPPLMRPEAIAPATGARPADRGRIVPVIQLPKTSIPLDFSGFGENPGPQGGSSGALPGAGPGTDSPDPPNPDSDHVFNVNQVEVPPVPTYAPKPLYPEIAREARVTGRVVLQVLVRADGSVGKVRVMSGMRLLADAAQETLYRWRFQPAKSNGRAVAVWVEVPVVFSL